MGLIGAALKVTAAVVDALRDPQRRPVLPPSGAFDGEDLWEGPDDLWPPDPQISDTASAPQLVVTKQWGLRLPGGDIAWGFWQGIGFDNPLDRMKMVATLQKTAKDVGFGEGEQTAEFLAHYGWVTRNQIATVVYEDTGAYALTDTEVSTVGTPVGEASHGNNENQLSRQPPASPDPGSDLRPGPVGGDA